MKIVKEKDRFKAFKEKHQELFNVKDAVFIDEKIEVIPLVKAKIIKNTNLFSEGQYVYIIDLCHYKKYIVLGRYRKKGKLIIKKYTNLDILDYFTFKAVYNKIIINKLQGYYIYNYIFDIFLDNPNLKNVIKSKKIKNNNKEVISIETFIYSLFKRYYYFPENIRNILSPYEQEIINSEVIKKLSQEFIKNNLSNLEEKIFNIIQEIFKEDIEVSKILISSILTHSKVLTDKILPFLKEFSKENKGSFYLVERIRSEFLNHGFEEEIRFNLLLNLSSQKNSAKEVFKIIRKYYSILKVEQLKKIILQLYENYNKKSVLNLIEKFSPEVKEEIYKEFKNYLSPYLSFIKSNSEDFDELVLKLLKTKQKEKTLLSYLIKNQFFYTDEVIYLINKYSNNEEYKQVILNSIRRNKSKIPIINLIKNLPSNIDIL